MTKWEEFKINTYQSMLGIHGARFMIESFDLYEESDTLIVNYNNNKSIEIDVLPQEFSDVYAFEKELKRKLVIGKPQKKPTDVFYNFIKDRMSSVVYITKNEINNLAASLKLSVDYILKQIDVLRQVDDIYFIIKSDADKVKLPGGFDIEYNLPYNKITDDILNLLR